MALENPQAEFLNGDTAVPWLELLEQVRYRFQFPVRHVCGVNLVQLSLCRFFRLFRAPVAFHGPFGDALQRIGTEMSVFFRASKPRFDVERTCVLHDESLGGSEEIKRE